MPMQRYKFSLVMATLGRSEEIVLFLDSLLSQTYSNFELIIVDQNNDNRVANIYGKYKNKIAITHIKSKQKGLSLNRNIGLSCISGDIIAFPDDDCIYDSGTLEKVNNFFNENPDYSFYTCNTKDKAFNASILNTAKTDSDISPFNVMNVGISFTIFAKTTAFCAFRFDQQLGVGTPFGSGEESDLLFFLLKNKNKGRYHAGHFIYHPAKAETAEKAFLYGKGFGAVYKKAIFHYHFFSLFFIFALRLCKGIINIIIHTDKKMRRASLAGRFSGFFSYRKTKN
jgi:glycosyltransferase involved in cell wall biosynthesis